MNRIGYPVYLIEDQKDIFNYLNLPKELKALNSSFTIEPIIKVGCDTIYKVDIVD